MHPGSKTKENSVANVWNLKVIVICALYGKMGSPEWNQTTVSSAVLSVSVVSSPNFQNQPIILEAISIDHGWHGWARMGTDEE